MVIKDYSEERHGWNYMASRLFLECGHNVVLLEQSKAVSLDSSHLLLAGEEQGVVEQLVVHTILISPYVSY